MASAGARRAVARMACNVPSTAVATVMPMASNTSSGGKWCSKLGKRKNSAYKPVNITPNPLPSATPSAEPAATTNSTKPR